MQEIWNRIENWLRDNAPEVLEDLSEGAEDLEIISAEEYLDVKFPEDLKKSLKIHNGQKSNEGKFLLNGWKLLSVENIMEEWDKLKDFIESGDFDGIVSTNQGNIKKNWWNKKWLPLTHSGDGDYNCLDLDPPSAYGYGQIITFWRDMQERDLVSKSYRNWLETFANDLEDGKYVYMTEYNGIVIKD